MATKKNKNIKMKTGGTFRMSMYDINENDEINNYKKEFNKLLNSQKSNKKKKQFYKELIKIGRKEIPKEFKEQREEFPERTHKHKYLKDMFKNN